jgi:hypothetical protein
MLVTHYIPFAFEKAFQRSFQGNLSKRPFQTKQVNFSKKLVEKAVSNKTGSFFKHFFEKAISNAPIQTQAFQQTFSNITSA